MNKNGLIQVVLRACLAEKPGKWLRLATLGRPHDVSGLARLLEARGLVELRRVASGREIRLSREGRNLVQDDAVAVDQVVADLLDQAGDTNTSVCVNWRARIFRRRGLAGPPG